MTKPFRVLLIALLALPAIAAPASGQGAPGDQVSTPTKGALYFAGQSGRYLVDGTWYFRQDAPNQGLSQHFERQKDAAGCRETAELSGVGA